MISYLKANLGVITLGVVLGPVMLVTWPGFAEIGAKIYDRWNPVITDWVVTESRTDGEDLIVSGTMIKQRECVFIPPTLARDEHGRNLQVLSTSPTAGKSWASSDQPQRWGPWHVTGGAGKKLVFINLYQCWHASPTAMELGRFP